MRKGAALRTQTLGVFGLFAGVLGCGLYDLGNLFRLRGKDGVARLDFAYLAAGALRHASFKVRIDGAIFGRHDRPAFLRPPCRIAGLGGENLFRGKDLRLRRKGRFRFGKVGGEISSNSPIKSVRFAAPAAPICFAKLSPTSGR